MRLAPDRFEFNSRHPFAGNCVLCIADYYEHVCRLGVIPRNGHTKRGMGRCGPGIYNGNANEGGFYVNENSGLTELGLEFTLITFQSVDALASNNWSRLCVIPSSSSWSNPYGVIQWDNSGQSNGNYIRLSYRTGAAARQDVSVNGGTGTYPIGDGIIHQHAVRRSGSAFQFFLDGGASASGTGNTTTVDWASSRQGTCVFMQRHDDNSADGDGHTGTHLVTMFFRASFPDQWIADIYEDPYILVRPRRAVYGYVAPVTGDITVDNPVAAATGSALTEFLLSQVPPIASATGSAINPTVTISVIVANPVASATGSATTTFVLSQVPTPAVSTAAAVTEFILSQVPPTADGTGSAPNPTVQIGIVVVPPAAQGSATATTTYVLSQVPSAAEAVASGATTLVLSVTPAQAEAIILGVNPTVVFPGTEAAYVIVLDGVVFILDVNVPKTRVLTVEDTELTETGMTPGWAGWLTNKPRIRSKKVQE